MTHGLITHAVCHRKKADYFLSFYLIYVIIWQTPCKSWFNLLSGIFLLLLLVVYKV